MALPLFVAVSNDVFVAASGAATTVTLTGCVANDLIMMHSYIKVAGNFVNVSSITNIKDMTGTSNAKTDFATAAVGSTSTGTHEMKFGRAMVDGTCSYNVDDGGGAQPVFARAYLIRAVNRGRIILEDGWPFAEVSGGNGNWGFDNGTSTTPDTCNPSMDTGDSDRLGFTFICINANQAQTAFTGGEAWSKPVPEFATASGGGASIGFQIAPLPIKGTHGGGSMTITSAAWSTVYSALLPDNRSEVPAIGEPFWS